MRSALEANEIALADLVRVCGGTEYNRDVVKNPDGTIRSSSREDNRQYCLSKMKTSCTTSNTGWFGRFDKPGYDACMRESAPTCDVGS